MVFDVPTSVVMPGPIRMQCSVTRAMPKFYLSVYEVGQYNKREYVEGRFDGVIYKVSLIKKVQISSDEPTHTTDVECMVLWMKKTGNETFKETKQVVLHCESLTIICQI